MKRILLTGMSGTGKSTVIVELAKRGYRAVDADENGLSEVIAVPDDEVTGIGQGFDWVWHEDRIQELLSTDAADVLFLGGCSPNQDRFYGQFDEVILLSAPAGVIVDRLASRTNNPFGKHPDEVARVLELQRTIEPLLRRGATCEIDTSFSLAEVVVKVLRRVGLPDRPAGLGR